MLKHFGLLAAVIALSACTVAAPAQQVAAPAQPAPAGMPGPYRTAQQAQKVPAQAQQPVPAPQPQEEQPAQPAQPSYPITLNGPDNKAVATINADGTITGSYQTLADFLKEQKGGNVLANMILALLAHDLRQQEAAPTK